MNTEIFWHTMFVVTLVIVIVCIMWFLVFRWPTTKKGANSRIQFCLNQVEKLSRKKVKR